MRTSKRLRDRKRCKEQLDHNVSSLKGTNTPEEFLAHAQEAMKVFFYIRNQLIDVLDSDVENQPDEESFERIIAKKVKRCGSLVDGVPNPCSRE